MKITLEFLKRHNACEPGIYYIVTNNYIGLNNIAFAEKLIKERKLYWANWLIVRTMKYKQYVEYSIYAAEQVIKIYEANFPKDDRPRKAIEAAKLCLISSNKNNKANAAYAAANAFIAANATNAAANATNAATSTAYAASAAYITTASTNGNIAAGASATNAVGASATKIKMQLKILKYGLKLIKNENNKI